MKKLILSIVALLFFVFGIAQKTIQERLGYPKDAKLLIIHADDIGVSHSENMATITALEKGSVRSGSIMVPCPWFPEIAAYAVSHPDADLGLHLTLTSEWKYYRWGAVAKDKAPSLMNHQGFLYGDVDSLGMKASLKEIEIELRAQIDRAIQFGIKPTHFDSHMAGCFITKDFLKVYLALAREYKVPCLLNKDAFKILFKIDLDELITDKDVVVDRIFMANPPDFKNGMANYYSGVFKSIQPGLNCVLIHVAYDNDEMKAVTVDHPDYGSAWRQADFDFFTSDACKKQLDELKIKVITWKEIKEKLYSN